ncbi:alpha-ketoglutarate-dependent dioxygenase AlkB [Neolewinella persica]|uniref:alpha-ketoglutarate-dependent dioxygenase AlkB n=1 Tax=Neolewinella persica TaxID=70998 RepID=UPI00038125D6|nr:alpha-ketoglutarate-dependent dioxygenase AlkB [Neolewinella persica]
MLNSSLFSTVSLDAAGHVIYRTNFPITDLLITKLETLWELHPEEFHTLMMHGKEVKTPRWQQAYGYSYEYSGSRNNALPIPEILEPFLAWGQQNVDPRLNGLLLNWYDGTAGHYMGPHRDARKGLVPDSPIVTISRGEERIFRIRPWQGDGYRDTLLTDGSVLVMPWATNLSWTHEIPKMKKYLGRRISVTLRAFAD